METALAISQAKYWHLKQVDLFHGLASSEVRQLGDFFDTDLYEQGTQIYCAGDLSDRIYVLKSGKVKLSKTAEDGKEFILYFIRPGEVFGELAITGQALRSGSATVVEDAFVCSIRREHFEDFILRNPDVALEISKIIGERKQKIEQRVLDLVTKDVRTRLAHTLGQLADEFGLEEEDGRMRIDLRLTQSDLAQLVGSTRETTSTVFNEFRRDGLVESEGRSIWVLNHDALSEYSWMPRLEHSSKAA
ncbi:MAG: Crp/Fnr family transcriptional regulator [Acidobacteriota bacterium]